MADEIQTIKKKQKPSKRKVIGARNIKGNFTFVGNDKRKYRLTMKEKLFCEKFLDYKGNGAEAAFEVFRCKNIRVAAAIASEYLTKPNIIAYIDKRLDETGFCDDNVKKQHLFTLNQFSDLSAKNKAIDMFYRIQGKYAPEDVNVNLNPYKDLSNAELVALEKKLIEGLTNRRKK